MNNLVNGNAKDILKTLERNSVHLCVTSPPYFNAKDYSQYETLEQYRREMRDVFLNLYPVMTQGARLCLNIADYGRNPLVSLSSLYIDMLSNIGYILRANVIWDKGNSARLGTGWGCFPDGYRVVTKKGVIDFRDVDINSDEFATINTKTKKLEWQKAFNYIEKDFDGYLKQFKNRTTDITVTPDHQILIENTQLGQLELYSAKDIRSTGAIPRRHSGLDKDIDDIEYFELPKVKFGKRSKKTYSKRQIDKIKMDDFLAFLGIYLTDGSVYVNRDSAIYKVSIYQSKDRHIEELESLLGRLPFKFGYKPSKFEYYTCGKQLSLYLEQFGMKNDRKIPGFIRNLSVRQQEIFIKWLLIGDGSFSQRQNRYTRFCSPSKEFIKSLVPILVNCGYDFREQTRKPRGDENRTLNGRPVINTKSLHILRFRTSEHTYISGQEIKDVRYTGKVRCVSVPNKTILVEKDGKYSWCGNSWLSASFPSFRDVHEYILVFGVDTHRLDGEKDDVTITKEEFLEYTQSIWRFNTENSKANPHPAPFPVELPRRCIQLLSYRGNTVIDPFMGAGTTGVACEELDRNFIGIEINNEFYQMATKRIENEKGK